MKFIIVLLFFITSVFANVVNEQPKFINLTEKSSKIKNYEEKRTFESFNKNSSNSCINIITNSKLSEKYKEIGSPSFVVLYNRVLDGNIYEPKINSSIINQYGEKKDFIKKIYLPLNDNENTLTKKEIWQVESCISNYLNLHHIKQVDRNFILRAGEIGLNKSNSAREIEIVSLSKSADYLIEIVFDIDKNYKLKIIKLSNGEVIFNEDSLFRISSKFKKSSNNDFKNIIDSNLISKKISKSFDGITKSLITHWNYRKSNEINAKDRIEEQNKALGIYNNDVYIKRKTDNNGVKSTGTAFFISDEGYLITNNHVIEGSKSILIDYKNKSYDAKIIDIDKNNDIALIKIDLKSSPFIHLDNIDAVKGSNICALGYPLINMQGKELKATFGHINSLSGFKSDPRFMQIDSSIQPGNSGGPLVNNKGKVVGIVTAKLNQIAAYKASGSFSQNVNYALKISYALPLIKKNKITLNNNNSKKLNNSELVKLVSKSVVLVKTK